MLGHWWQAWSNSPPPPEVVQLLAAVRMGRPLNLYLRL
jgi:hypothetical protein